MSLVPRIYEDLRLGLSEFPEPDHTLAGRDLISEGLADLHCRKRQRVPEVAQEPGEVDEHALRRLRPEIACHLVSRTDHGLEHEIELVDLGELSAALRAADLVLLDAFVDLFVAECIRDLDNMLDEVVCPVDLFALLAAGEGIGEAAQMATEAW